MGYMPTSRPASLGHCDSPVLTAASPNLNESTLSSFNSKVLSPLLETFSAGGVEHYSMKRNGSSSSS